MKPNFDFYCEKVRKGENIRKAFLELVKAGLFPVNNSRFTVNGFIDWESVYLLAEQQGVVGLVAAGIEWLKVHNSGFTVPQTVALTFAGATIQIEQRNKAMNQFIAELEEKMRAADIYTLLVKGQGVAQCYERPLWRPSGDVDFLLSEDNYKKARAYLLPLSSGNKNEERYSQHLGMSIEQWYVEIHGTLRTGLATRVDRQVDAVQKDVFYGGNVRSWLNGGTQVFLPAPDEDVFLVFTHFIKHFYKEGVSLRQLCDWCRLLWTYRSELDVALQEQWLRQAGLVEEWQVFSVLAVEYLGMPVAAMPMYNHSDSCDLRKKAEKLVEFILGGYSGNKIKDTWQIAKVFPWKALHYSPSIFLNVNWLKVKEWLFNSK
ncbi:MAG: nucleotidyltransferase family protein [Bacteroidales bacterium]|nr:nucleotidyltransferase family protein [Bacteroidales bacterium]